MATQQQEAWMAQATRESDGSPKDIERRFVWLVRSHVGPYEMPHLTEQQGMVCCEQSFADAMCAVGRSDTERFVAYWCQRTTEYQHQTRLAMLHPEIVGRMFERRLEAAYQEGRKR